VAKKFSRQEESNRDGNAKNNIHILIEWDSLDDVRKFVGSDAVKKALKDSGAVKSDFHFLNEVEKVEI